VASRTESDTRARAAAIVARIPRAEAAGEMSAEMESQVAALERISEQSHAEVLEGVKRSLARWSRFLMSGVMPPEESFEPLRAWARARAAEGVRLEDLLRSFALAHQLGWQLLRRHARDDESEALLELAGLLAEYHDQVAAVATETYLGEREVLVSEVERSAWSLLEALCTEEPLSASQIELAERFGVPLGRPLRPFAILTSDQHRHRQSALAARLRSAHRALAVTEGDTVAGLTWCELELADVGLGGQVLLVLAEPSERRGLREARAEVALLAEHGRRHGLTGHLETREHVLEILIAGAPELSRRLRENMLAPLQSAEHPELVQTLMALVECRLDRKAASAKLHVHRNTLAYRLRRIEELAGVDLGSPRDLACVYVALAAERDEA
jgi:PucR C-terminal helix-turn-helix domain